MTFPRFKFPVPPLATNATLRHEADKEGEKPCVARVEIVETALQEVGEGSRHDATFAAFRRFSFPKGQKAESPSATLATLAVRSAEVQARVAESRKPDREDTSSEKPLKVGTFEPCGPEKPRKVAGVAKVTGPLSQNSTPKPRNVAKSQKSQGVTLENEKSGTCELLDDWRAAISAARSDLPDIAKLKRESLRFLDGPDALTAVDDDWDAISLFGMHEGQAPKERIDCWGLVLFLAWGVHGCTVDTIGQKVCALRTRSGAVQTQPRLRTNFDQALPWWEHPGITSTKDHSDE